MTRLLDITNRLRRGPVAILAGAIFLAAVLIASRPERPALVLPEKSWSVEVMAAQPGEIQPTLELYARVESPEDAVLTSAIEADVLEVLVQDGESVTAGTPLLRLDDRDAQLELLQREADVQEIEAQVNLERRRLVRNREALVRENELLALAESTSERARSLYKDKLVSAANLDDSAGEFKRQQLAVTSRTLAIEESEIRIQQLSAQLRRAEALRDGAQLTLERALISAPFDGAISDMQVSLGARVRVGEALMRIHNPEKLELRTQVPGRFVPRVRNALTGASALRASVEAGGARYRAIVDRISGQTREGSGGVDAFLRFDGDVVNAELGATVRLLLQLPVEAQAVAVPAEAVYGRDRIYAVEGERMAALDIERVGERVLDDGRSEVIVRSPELIEGTLVVTSKLSNAAEGLLVSVRDDDLNAGNDASVLAARDGK